MGEFYYDGSYTRKCQVCLAGATMAFTLGKKLETIKIRSEKYQIFNRVYPADFSPSIECKLTALDYLRIGDVYSAMMRVGLSESKANKYFEDGLEERYSIPEYNLNRNMFHSSLRKLSKTLAKYGL